MQTEDTYTVGAQRDPSSTAGTELDLAVGTEVPTAVGKLGLVANATGGCIILVLALLSLLRFLRYPPHLLLIAGKLLVHTEERRGKERE